MSDIDRLLYAPITEKSEPAREETVKQVANPVSIVSVDPEPDMFFTRSHTEPLVKALTAEDLNSLIGSDLAYFQRKQHMVKLPEDAAKAQACIDLITSALSKAKSYGPATYRFEHHQMRPVDDVSPDTEEATESLQFRLDTSAAIGMLGVFEMLLAEAEAAGKTGVEMYRMAAESMYDHAMDYIADVDKVGFDEFARQTKNDYERDSGD